MAIEAGGTATPRRRNDGDDGIARGTLDLSGAYRRTFDATLPQARQVADPFHAVRLANGAIDEVRRRTQNDTLGHRGRKDDPLWRARRTLIAAHERPSERGDAKLCCQLAAGDPRGEVRLAWHANQTRRGLYDIDCPQLAGAYLGELAEDLTDADNTTRSFSSGDFFDAFAMIISSHQTQIENCARNDDTRHKPSTPPPNGSPLSNAAPTTTTPSPPATRPGSPNTPLDTYRSINTRAGSP